MTGQTTEAGILKGALSSLKQFSVTESSLKMIKNAFYFISKAYLVLKILFSFCFEFLVMCKNDLIRKIRLISKFIRSQPAKQAIALHIMPKISRSKDNWTMEFGQLIEYNMRNIFLQKSYTNCGEETIPRHYSKKLKVSISLDQ